MVTRYAPDRKGISTSRQKIQSRRSLWLLGENDMTKYKIKYHYRKSYFKQLHVGEFLKKKNKGQKTVIVSKWGKQEGEKVDDSIRSIEEAKEYFNWKYNQGGWKVIDKIRRK